MSSRHRAAAALDLRDGTARAAFLRSLPSNSFLPSEEAVAALHYLEQVALPLGSESYDAVARFEAADFDAFRMEYWQLPAPQRRSQWKKLFSNATHADTRAALESLDAGLDVDAVPWSNDRTAELAGLVREWYLLPPRARSVGGSAWLSIHGLDVAWIEAANALQEEHPALASLAAGFLETLRRGPEIPESIVGVTMLGTQVNTGRSELAVTVDARSRKNLTADELLDSMHNSSSDVGRMVITLGLAFAAFCVLALLFEHYWWPKP